MTGLNDSRIILAGHSHIFALSGPLYSEVPGLVGLCEQPEVRVLTGGWPRGDDYWQALVDAVPGADVALVWGGNEHNVCYFFEADHAFDFVSKQVGSLLPSFQIVPKTQIRRRLTNAGVGQLGDVLTRLRAAGVRRLVVLGTPPPKRDNDALRALLASEPFFVEMADHLGHSVDTVPITAPRVRLKLWYLLQEMLAEHARAASAVFVPVPSETQDDDGFLRPEMWAPDVTHANEVFGRLMFQAMLAAFEQGEGPGDAASVSRTA
jgi:hypothetical protein